MAAFDTSIRDRAIKECRKRLEQERRSLIYAVAETLRKIGFVIKTAIQLREQFRRDMENFLDQLS